MESYILSIPLILIIIIFSAKTRKEINDEYFWRFLSIINKKVKIIYSDWPRLAKKIHTQKINYENLLVIILGYTIRKYIEELKISSGKNINNLEEFTKKLIESIDYYEINLSPKEIAEFNSYQQTDSFLDKIKNQVKIQSEGLIEEIEKQLDIKLSESAMIQLKAKEIFVIYFQDEIKELNLEINSEKLKERKKRFSIIKFILFVSLGFFILLFSWWNFLTYTRSQNGYITVEDKCLKYFGNDCKNPSVACRVDGDCDCMCVEHSYKTISIKEKMFEDLPDEIAFSLIGSVVASFIYLSKKENS